jgi:hypothetical protein
VRRRLGLRHSDTRLLVIAQGAQMKRYGRSANRAGQTDFLCRGIGEGKFRRALQQHLGDFISERLRHHLVGDEEGHRRRRRYVLLHSPIGPLRGSTRQSKTARVSRRCGEPAAPPASPVDTRLPLRSSTALMPRSASVISVRALGSLGEDTGRGPAAWAKGSSGARLVGFRSHQAPGPPEVPSLPEPVPELVTTAIRDRWIGDQSAR